MIKIDWLPQSGTQWKTFTAVRLEAGRLWPWLVERHATARQQGGKLPTRAELQKAIKRQFPGREIKATIQLRNKRLAEITAQQSHKTKGSRRYKRLQRCKYRIRTLARAECHRPREEGKSYDDHGAARQ